MEISGDFPDRIYMKGMSFYGHTGVYDFEKSNGQRFVVDLVLCFLHLEAAKTDIITDTVDYGEAFAVVKEIVENSGFDLIERLAGEIVSRLMSNFPAIDAVEVSVSKPDAPVKGEFEAMGVRIFRSRKPGLLSDKAEGGSCI